LGDVEAVWYGGFVVEVGGVLRDGEWVEGDGEPREGDVECDSELLFAEEDEPDRRRDGVWECGVAGGFEDVGRVQALGEDEVVIWVNAEDEEGVEEGIAFGVPRGVSSGGDDSGKLGRVGGPVYGVGREPEGEEGDDGDGATDDQGVGP